MSFIRALCHHGRAPSTTVLIDIAGGLTVLLILKFVIAQNCDGDEVQVERDQAL